MFIPIIISLIRSIFASGAFSVTAPTRPGVSGDFPSRTTCGCALRWLPCCGLVILCYPSLPFTAAALFALAVVVVVVGFFEGEAIDSDCS